MVACCVRAQSDGHGNRTWSNREGQGQRIKGLTVKILWPHTLVELLTIVYTALFEHGPTGGDHDKSSTNLHYGQRDPEELENVTPDEVRPCQHEERIDGYLLGQLPARFLRIILGSRQKNRASAQRIDNGKQGAQHQQESFGGFHHEAEYI